MFLNGNVVGDASIKTRQSLGITNDDFLEWQAAGFYAIAYELPDEVVISYRGTSDRQPTDHPS